MRPVLSTGRDNSQLSTQNSQLPQAVQQIRRDILYVAVTVYLAQDAPVAVVPDYR